MGLHWNGSLLLFRHSLATEGASGVAVVAELEHSEGKLVKQVGGVEWGTASQRYNRDDGGGDSGCDRDRS